MHTTLFSLLSALLLSSDPLSTEPLSPRLLPAQQRWVRIDSVQEFCLAPQLCQPSEHPLAMQGRELPLIQRQEGYLQLRLYTGTLDLQIWLPESAAMAVVRTSWTYSSGPRGPTGVTLLPGYGLGSSTADVEIRQQLHATIPGRSLSHADIAGDFELWIQPEVEGALFELTPGAALLPRPRAGAEPLALVNTAAPVRVLKERDGWFLVRWQGELVEIVGWTQTVPTPLVPIAYGYCAGVHGMGQYYPPMELELPGQTSLYASASHQVEVGQTTQEQRHVIEMDQAGAPFLPVSLPWGEAQAHLATLPDPGLEQLRGWAGQGTLWVWRGQSPCLQATLTLEPGWFPDGDLVVQEPGESAAEQCTRSTSMSWVGAAGMAYSGLSGMCELEDGSGSGWGGSEIWLDPAQPLSSDWALFAGEWMHPDQQTCEQGLPQGLEMVPLRGWPWQEDQGE